MQWNDPEYREAIRLARRFFPECKPYVSEHQGIAWDDFVTAMKLSDWCSDFSCDPTRGDAVTLSPFYRDGGFTGSETDVFTRLLNFTRLTPIGRALVIPEALAVGQTAADDDRPIVCNAKRVAERLVDNFFCDSRDLLMLFESGEAIAVNHDQCLFWARSRSRCQPSQQ